MSLQLVLGHLFAKVVEGSLSLGLGAEDNLVGISCNAFCFVYFSRIVDSGRKRGHILSNGFFFVVLQIRFDKVLGVICGMVDLHTSTH